MRRRGRECALQLLYQLDVLNPLENRAGVTEGLDLELAEFWDNFEPVQSEERQFAERLVFGVVRATQKVDQVLSKASDNWKLPRMANVDRNSLRLACYEILFCEDIPRVASINEAVEIAKRFSSTDAASFINGILDQLGKDSELNQGS